MQSNPLFVVRANGDVFVRGTATLSREEGARLLVPVLVSDGGTPARVTLCQVRSWIEERATVASASSQQFRSFLESWKKYGNHGVSGVCVDRVRRDSGHSEWCRSKGSVSPTLCRLSV